MTNFEKIKAMTVEEMADLFRDIYEDEYGELRIDGGWMLPEDVEEWLESECEEDD